jgi:hypothetical protein
MPASIPSNFGFLRVHDEQLVRFGLLAESFAFWARPGVLRRSLVERLAASTRGTRTSGYSGAELRGRLPVDRSAHSIGGVVGQLLVRANIIRRQRRARRASLADRL